MSSAYFLSHNGLGDTISNIGAINFLLQHYDTIYLLCKDIYEENVKLLFTGKAVVTVPFNSRNERQRCYSIISVAKLITPHDIFISGFFHTSYLTSRITHPAILNHVKHNDYLLKYPHILQFYTDIGLDSSIYKTYFGIDSTEISRKAYTDISHLNIIFLHTQGSNRSIDLSELISKYINNTEYILVCANKNVYPAPHPYHTIAAQYTTLKVASYIDIITHAEQIHVIDSCFSCIVYPLQLANRFADKECVIYDVPA
jgi:hypothetical protein